MDAYRPLQDAAAAAAPPAPLPAEPTKLALQAALVAMWIAVNLGITLVNKAVFSHYAFVYPLSLSLLHQALTWLAIALTLNVVYPAAYTLGNVPDHERTEAVQAVPPQNRWRYVLFGVLNAANVCASNAAMRYASVSLREVVASTTPVLVCVGFVLQCVLRTHCNLT